MNAGMLMICRRVLVTLLAGLAAVCGAARAGEEAKPGSAVLSRLASTGTIYLTHRESAAPFSYLLSDGLTPAGYSWDTCLQVVKGLEARLGKRLTVVPVVATPNSRFMQVKAGMAEIGCGADTHTIAREKLVAFSTTFFVAEVRAMVRANAGIRSLQDFDRRRVVTLGGSTADRLVKMHGLQNGFAIQQISAGGHDEALAILERGEADIYVADDAILAGQRVAARDPSAYVLLEQGFSAEPYGLVLPPDDDVFRKTVNDILSGLMVSGEMGKIYDRWFMQPLPESSRRLELPMSPAVRDAFANPNDLPVN